MITDINDIKALKDDAEARIRQIIIDFKNETGLDIEVKAEAKTKYYDMPAPYNDKKVVGSTSTINITVTIP